jgi:hypothetical protein
MTVRRIFRLRNVPVAGCRLPVAGLLFLSFLLPAAAHAETGLLWLPQPVRRVPIDSVQPVAPFVPATTPEITGPVDIGPQSAAALWLDPLDLVRVRQLRGGPPRFARVAGEAGARALLDEPGVPAATGVWYLAQPPGRGDVWLVTARDPASIVVERVVRRRGRMVWDEVEAAVLRWIDAGGDGPPPELPAAAGAGEARLRLLAEQQLGARLASSGRALARAVPAWRKASAVTLLVALRPLVEGAFTLQPLTLPGGDDDIDLSADDEGARPWRRVEAGARATVELDGPGALRVEARRLLIGGGRLPATLSVLADGELLARAVADADPVAEPDVQEPPPAFPLRRPLTTGGGVGVGARAEITVPLASRRRLEIRVEGGPLLWRAVHARRRPRLGQAGASPASLIAAARAALGDDDRPAAQALRARLARLDGAAASSMPPVAVEPDSELRWLLLVEKARRLAGAGDDVGLRQLFDDLDAPPPAEALALLGPLLPEPTLVERLRSPRVSALELAWRGQPLDPDVLAAARAAWRSAAWSLLAPDDESQATGDRRPRTRGWTWLVDSGGDPLAAPGSWTEVAAGRALRVVAPTAAAARATLLPAYLLTDAGEPGPVAVGVDGETFRTVALAPLERVEVAVPAGEHTVRLAGPPGTRLFVGLPPLDPPAAGSADVRRYWPLAVDGRSVRFRLPEPLAPAPVRISLRVVDPAPGEPIKVAVRGDAGERRTLTFTPGGRDDHAVAIDAPGTVSGEASFVVRLAPGVRELWLSAPAGRQVVASVAVRRHADDGGKEPSATTTSTSTSSLTRIGEISRALKPGDARALLERASLLLELEQPDLARADLVRLASLPLDAAEGRAANQVLDRVESLTDSADVGAVDRPVLLMPGLAGDGLDAVVPAARALRRLGPDDARAALPDHPGPAVDYVRARVSGDPLALARLALDSDSPALLVDACTRLVAALEAGTAPRGAASVLFGLATRARERADHPRVRRALALASALSRWQSIDGTEQSAGQERIDLAGRPPPSTPGAAAREALLAPPWDPARAATLDAGEGSALALDLRAPARLSTQIFCAELRPGPAPASCLLTLAIDGSELKLRAVAGRIGKLPPRTLAAGRHTVSLTLDAANPDVIASVRFLTERPLSESSPGEPEADGAGYAAPMSRSVRSFVAAPRRPIELAVLGPTTLRIELRGDEAGTQAVLEPGGLRQTLDGAPVERLLVLTEPGAHRIQVRADKGRVLARFSLREDRPQGAGAAPPLPDPWWYDAKAPSLLPWPGLPAPLTTVAADAGSECPCSSFGTLSLEVGAGNEAVGERDAPLALLGVGQVGADWRRRLAEDAWLRLGAFARGREGLTVSAGFGARAYLRELLPGLRTDARLLAVTQQFAGQQAFSVNAALRFDRSFSVGPTLSFVPSFAARAAWLSLERTTVVMAGPGAGELDPDVYNDYLRTHAVQLTPRAGFYWAPWADQVGELAVFAATTRQLRLDLAGAELEWRSLFPSWVRLSPRSPTGRPGAWSPPTARRRSSATISPRGCAGRSGPAIPAASSSAPTAGSWPPAPTCGRGWRSSCATILPVAAACVT